MMKIGVTGGIGSGKSTVCRLFAQKGIAVYESDAAAKRLMQQDDTLRMRLTERFGADTFRDGQLDWSRLAGVVFSDPQALADLNALVHPVVMGRPAGGALRDSRKRDSLRGGPRNVR